MLPSVKKAAGSRLTAYPVNLVRVITNRRGDCSGRALFYCSEWNKPVHKVARKEAGPDAYVFRPVVQREADSSLSKLATGTPTGY